MIEIKIESTRVTHALARLARAGNDMSPVMKAIGEALVKSTHEHFDKGTTPTGQPWEKNSDVTLARKKETRPLFGETGLLSQLIHYEAGPRQVIVGSPMEYAAMQQFGGKRSRFPNLWGDIPARPFLGISKQDGRNIVYTVHGYLRAQIG